MDYKEKIEEKWKKMVDTLISFIEQDPTQWEAGWYRAPSVSPMNGKTQKKRLCDILCAFTKINVHRRYIHFQLAWWV